MEYWRVTESHSPASMTFASRNADVLRIFEGTGETGFQVKWYICLKMNVVFVAVEVFQ